VVGVAGRAGYRELRLALVFNGGVSLAVWMGGVAREIDRFRTAFYRDPPLEPYRALLDTVQTEVLADVIAGTSAGGINGAMLAYAVGNGRALEGASDEAIRDVWERLGQIRELLHRDHPPTAALDDEYLFQGCADVFDTLAAHAPALSGAPTAVRLTVTATDCAGYPIAVDGVDARDHRLEMRFHATRPPENDEILLSPQLRAAIAEVVPPPGPKLWPFPRLSQPARDLRGPDAGKLLARATRSTASFPIAFAPSELPLAGGVAALAGDQTGLTATPSMRDVITTRVDGDVLGDRPSRYVVDGGIWDNAPFEAVLRSIDRAPSARAVDRRLVYVIYTDEAPPTTPAAGGADQPPELIGSIVHTLTGPSNVSFANDLERIARDMGRQRDRRDRFRWLLKPGNPDVFALTEQLLPVYLAQNAEANPPATLRTAEPPLASKSLADWGATATDWSWGIRPVQVAVETGRWLLREVLSELVSSEPNAGALVTARETLSQLSSVLFDLIDRRSAVEPPTSAESLTSAERTVCGAVMAQFADTIDGVYTDVLATVPRAALDGARMPATEIGLAWGEGGPETIIRRALATEIAVHALSADDRPHKVDYRFDAIRPDDRWPLLSGDADADAGPRPPLAGLKYGHFGGFLRSSWRLNDWMWGRLDATSCIVSMLLDAAQITRLTGGTADGVAALAGRLAELAIPDDATDPRAGYLAYCAFAGHDLSDAPDGPPDPRVATAPVSAEQLQTWRAVLSGKYAGIVAAVAEAGEPPAGLELIQADVRRRLQYAIVDEERPALVGQINAERLQSRPHSHRDPDTEPLADDQLARQLDAGLRAVSGARTQAVPMIELAGYAEDAASNLLDVLKHPTLADAAQASHSMTSFIGALEQGTATLCDELRRLRPHHQDR
jgi:predicted acylesterase/phospholipase RssA